MKNKSVFIYTSLLIFTLIIYCSYSLYNKIKHNSREKLSTVKVEKVVEELEDSTFIRIPNLPSNFDTVPGGNNVYRTNQPSLKQLKQILTTYDIQTVIRMNDTEGTGVSISDERNLVESMGKTFIWYNAHIGYKPDKGYTKSLDTLQPYLHAGKVLIHCTAGADRTGYQVAKYIEDKLNWTDSEIWNYTIKYNDWEHYICRGQMGYVKYMKENQ